MTRSLEALPFEQIESMLAEKRAEFEKAFDEGKPVPELNQLYQQLKNLQLEINLRRLQVSQNAEPESVSS